MPQALLTPAADNDIENSNYSKGNERKEKKASLGQDKQISC